MKDRLQRTNVKKPSHHLTHAVASLSVLTVVILSAFSIFLFSLSKETKILNKTIDNYTEQINQLDTNIENNTLLKNNADNND